MQRTKNTQNRVVVKKRKPVPKPNPQKRTAFAPAAYATPQVVKEPRIVASRAGTVITHREYLGDITGSVAFDLDKSLDINPGLASTFPWLSTQASGWEQYRFRKLDFEVVTRAPTTVTGGVYLAPDYDVLDADPNSELQISTYRDTVEDAAWKDQVCRLDPSAMFPMGPRKYIRSGLVSSADLKSYDAGRFYVATVGQADTSAVGKLWASYIIEFFVPQTDNLVAPAVRDFAQFNLSTGQSITTNVATTAAYDETVTNAVGVVNSLGHFTLPRGNWLVYAEVEVSGGTAASQALTLEVLKNVSSLSPPCLSKVLDAGAASGQVMRATIQRYVFSDGTDEVSISTIFGSSTGTLSLSGDHCRISFQLL